MSNSDNGTAKLIIGAVVGGIVLLIAVALLAKKQEVVSLPIVFEEFTDFECPACAAYHPLINQLKTEYSSDNVSFVFKNYPLTSIHADSYNAHLAAYAAKQQGKFDEYANLLFENQDKLKAEQFLTFATQLKLDTTKFSSDMASAEAKAAIDADMAEGTNRGINATPTFYINGKKVIFKETDNPELVLREKLASYIAKTTAK